MADETRETEIRRIWADHWLFYKLLGAGALVAIGVLVGRVIYADEGRGFEVNLFTEAISIGVTVLILDELNRRRSKREAEEALKQQLVMDAASLSNEKAKDAVHQLWRRGWLHGNDGLLKGADLTAANLQGAGLMGANLQGADLRTANLQDANLRAVNLQGAKLSEANLQGADLWLANLQRADLSLATLAGANLKDADLRKSFLFLAHMKDANFSSIWHGNRLVSGSQELKNQFDSETLLPDGNNWTSESDICIFTDPNHPDFEQHLRVKNEPEA